MSGSSFPSSSSRMDAIRANFAAVCKERDELKRELQTYRTSFNEKSLLKLTSQLLGIPPDRIRSLAEADKAGRLVEMPPCRSGDDVWVIYDDEIHRLRVQGMSLTVTNKVLLHFGGYPITCIYALELGKKFFLTREEAEAALKGGEP